MSRVFTSDQKTRVQSRVESCKNSRIVLDTALLNSQNYKTRIKGEVKQSRKLNSTLPYTSLS